MRKRWKTAELTAAWTLVNESKACDHCGGYHTRSCPRVKRLVFFPPQVSGGPILQEVEFWPHGEWPHEEVIFPDLLPFAEEDSENA
jgi:hypothetical protein